MQRAHLHYWSRHYLIRFTIAYHACPRVDHVWSLSVIVDRALHWATRSAYSCLRSPPFSHDWKRLPRIAILYSLLFSAFLSFLQKGNPILLLSTVCTRCASSWLGQRRLSHDRTMTTQVHRSPRYVTDSFETMKASIQSNKAGLLQKMRRPNKLQAPAFNPGGNEKQCLGASKVSKHLVDSQVSGAFG